MGIISTGNDDRTTLSGTAPTTAIMSQIAIMIISVRHVCLTVFCSLTFGYKTLYNNRNQIEL